MRTSNDKPYQVEKFFTGCTSSEDAISRSVTAGAILRIAGRGAPFCKAVATFETESVFIDNKGVWITKRLFTPETPPQKHQRIKYN